MPVHHTIVFNVSAAPGCATPASVGALGDVVVPVVATKVRASGCHIHFPQQDADKERPGLPGIRYRRARRPYRRGRKSLRPPRTDAEQQLALRVLHRKPLPCSRMNRQKLVPSGTNSVSSRTPEPHHLGPPERRGTLTGTLTIRRPTSASGTTASRSDLPSNGTKGTAPGAGGPRFRRRAQSLVAVAHDRNQTIDMRYEGRPGKLIVPLVSV